MLALCCLICSVKNIAQVHLMEKSHYTYILKEYRSLADKNPFQVFVIDS